MINNAGSIMIGDGEKITRNAHHIKIRYHHIRDLVQKGILSHFSNSTNSLLTSRHLYFASVQPLREPHSPRRPKWPATTLHSLIASDSAIFVSHRLNQVTPALHLLIIFKTRSISVLCPPLNSKKPSISGLTSPPQSIFSSNGRWQTAWIYSKQRSKRWKWFRQTGPRLWLGTVIIS